MRRFPKGSAFTSFPSGHTSLAFAGAEFLFQEYRYKSVWFGIAGYTLASATGIIRVYNNVHWFSDIVAGLGFGVASTKLAYLVYPKLKHAIFENKSANFTFTPAVLSGSPAFTLHGTF